MLSAPPIRKEQLPMPERSTSALALSADPASSDPFLRATDVVDWTTPEIRELASTLAESVPDPSDRADVARACFAWVRDQIQHCVDYDRDELPCRASDVLRVGTGYCYAKSHLLVALLRANGLRSGFCYQRLVVSDPEGPFVVHGLAAVDLGTGTGEPVWYRIDPRGNKPGVDAQFIPPVEQLAYETAADGEWLFPEVYADPVPLIVRTLTTNTSARALLRKLPDPATEADLEA